LIENEDKSTKEASFLKTGREDEASESEKGFVPKKSLIAKEIPTEFKKTFAPPDLPPLYAIKALE
jgi:hypothetical protein